MEDERRDKDKHATESDNSRTQLKVLIVDDDKVVRLTHKMLLDRVGVKDHVAVENGKEAVELHNNGQSFDLILMDKDMPVMNGIEATRTLRSMGVSCKIIGVSTSTSNKIYVQEFVEAGLDDFYTKPLTVQILGEILEKIKS
ncbi:two-component response regulator ORR41 [Vigna radiata var. radiata]|uniref:Two-component response regulator ORR41 n=1 Tax=Vigna radiata var. radiata TaxID=3916 RepID=A0A1S3TMK3_VIGRR|nr:two-component response regulator ORR41 [Vigna radiata var. radiata]